MINKKLLFFLMLFGSFLTNTFAQNTNQSPPNFIVIFADDLGYGDLSSFGHPSIHTPHLDQMAIEGQQWTNFYVGASVCTPSRAALMTGRLPVRNGLMSNKSRVFFPDSKNGIPASEITIAEQLKKAGYATHMIGKWHLGHREAYLPTNHGFDSYFGIPYSNDMDYVVREDLKSTYWDLWKVHYDKLKTEDFNVPLLRDKEVIERPANQYTIVNRYTDEAIKIIDQHQTDGQPFFLYLAHNLPHVPLFVSEQNKGKSKNGLYGDVVEEIDLNIGRMISALKEKQMHNNTIIVFTSDNGPWLQTDLSGGTAGMLRDGKGSTFEGGVREPTIFWGPGHVQPGRINQIGSTMDLFATFSAMAGVALPEDRILDSYDLSPVLTKRLKGERNKLFYYRERELYAVRLGAFKAHFITKGGYGDFPRTLHNPPLLYNLDEDPAERFNIAQLHPEILREIKVAVDEHQKNMSMPKDLLAERDPKYIRN